MNKYQKAIEVIDTLLHLMCGEEREDGYKPTMEEMSKSMDLLKDLANKADAFEWIPVEEKEKTAEKMFNDLDYKKHIKDGCIDFKRHTENVDEALIEFDLDTKTICASWFMEQKEITIAELKAINQQCKELNWL